MASDDDRVIKITDVNSRTPDGTYGFGSSIDIIVTFSGPIFVDGVASLEMDVGIDDSSAEFEGILSDTQLVFKYQVGEGAFSEDLNYLTPESLKVDGGGVIDAQTQRQVERLGLPRKGAVGSLSANRNLKIDARDVSNGTSRECSGDIDRAPVEFVVKWDKRDGAAALETLIKKNLGNNADRPIGVMLLFGGARNIGQVQARKNADDAAQLLIASGWKQVKDMYYKPLFDQGKPSGMISLSIFLERDC
jgi:hypothetical protein